MRGFPARMLATFVASGVLILTPAIAHAYFTAATTAAVTASTYKIPAPASADWIHSCSPTGRSYTLIVTGYGHVSKANSYRLIITAPDGSTSSPHDFTGDTTTLTKTSTRRGTYTFTIQALVGSWTGTAYTGSNSC